MTIQLLSMLNRNGFLTGGPIALLIQVHRVQVETHGVSRIGRKQRQTGNGSHVHRPGNRSDRNPVKRDLDTVWPRPYLIRGIESVRKITVVMPILYPNHQANGETTSVE
jgi:hypothetical protein